MSQEPAKPTAPTAPLRPSPTTTIRKGDDIPPSKTIVPTKNG
jgi:hypothetical protein